MAVHPACEQQGFEIREATVRQLLESYDAMEEQFDDPVGRRYCLGFDFNLETAGRPVPGEFLERFDDHPHVYPLEWCDRNHGRLISVGPVHCVSSEKAEIWSFSWVESRPGGSDCLHTVEWTPAGWKVADGCRRGKIYN